jgi:type II secretory pathway component PulF
MVKQMIISGERTGNTDECFLKASDYLRKEAMHGAQVLSLVLGTLIIMGLMFQYALGVGFALASIMFW